MTPEEDILILLDRARLDSGLAPYYHDIHRQAVAEIRRLREAVAGMRERCAREAEGWSGAVVAGSTETLPGDIAAAIRSLPD